MSLGLRSVLGVNTGLISAEGGAQKKSDTNEAQNFIQTAVNAMIEGTKKSDDRSADSLAWTVDVDYAANTYVLYDGGIYKSKKIISPDKKKKPDEDASDWELISNHSAFEKEVSDKLSFDANMVRKEMIAWGLGRVAADYQLDIDNTESHLDRWTSGLDLGISVINTLSNFFSGLRTRRSLVKMGDSYVMMAQDAAEGSDNTNFLYKFSANKKSDKENELGYKFYHKPMYNSPILLCIQSLCQAADQAMEEIADDKLDPESDSPERSVLYTKKISKIKQTEEEGRHEKEKSIVQNEIVDRVALYIANYYMISSFVAPYKINKGRLKGRLKRKYITLKTGIYEYVREIKHNASNNSNSKSYVGYAYKGNEIFNDYKLKVAVTETTLFEIYERNKYGDVNPNNTTDRNNSGLLPHKPYHLLLPMKVPDDKNLKNLKNEDIELFLEVVKVIPNVITNGGDVTTNGGDVTTNGAEVEVKIKLPEAIEASLSSSIVHSGFNFKFNIPEKIYKDGLTDNLVTGGKLNGNGEAAQQIFVDIAQNFVKAINPILEANPITGYAEMLTNAAPDIMDSSKLGIEWRRSQLFHKNNTKKGEFERAADCYGAIPTVLEHSLAYIKSGHYFDAATNVRSIGPTFITLIGTPATNSVELTWNAFPGATKYYVFKNGTPFNVENVLTGIIGVDNVGGVALTPKTSYSFYINAINDSGTVLAQSQTLMVTTAPAPEPEEEQKLLD